MKKILITISSRNPNNLLYMQIKNLYQIQLAEETNEFKILVVDSNSNDFSMYSKINKHFPQVEINYAKNINYEYGAWKHAYTKYPNYDIYFCIQDSLILRHKIDLNKINDSSAYIYQYTFGFRGSHKKNKPMVLSLLKDSNLDFLPIIGDTKSHQFKIANHNSFIVTKKTIDDIFKTLTVAPTSKQGANGYEISFGLYFICKNIKTIYMNKYVAKKHGMRS